ncbi:MAG TPA: transglutaminase-like domain-containing protein [Parapedobacter sp.]|uniref:transglutaminase-like domain-containing protein n=1 Tax=Parapedobacter sp. TaxID=1958893 RepID=UPI002CB552C5|nr:transglutaminase-like domain-containing protein [Parapedobacter sp.]HWK56629.1 transglutaminase-like domain-containing protein [Parapedobacter sp.]
MNEKEIDSLIKLLDDPDAEVFQHVEQKLIMMGPEVIGRLEMVWGQSFDVMLQTRIENLIHKIQFEDVLQELELWKLSGSFDLLQGLIIVNKYQYPDVDEQKIINQIEAIKRDAWLDMIYSMSAVEKVRLLNNILYNVHGFSGNTSNYHDPQNSYVGQVLETHKGNPILLACIYSIVAQKLDIPIYGVNLPKHFILAYTEDHTPVENKDGILFYINAFNRGQIFGRHDVVAFLKQLNLAPNDDFVLPCSNVDIITRVLRNLTTSYSQAGNAAKTDEINRMLDLLD